MRIEVNPAGVREGFLRSLNVCFPGWGDAHKYAWYFEPRPDAPAPDLLVVWIEGQLAAGTGLTYRSLRGPDDEPGSAAILTGSWTDPAFRGQGLFARLVEEARRHARARGNDHLLAFVRDDNPSMRGLLRAGARLIPTFYLRDGSGGSGGGSLPLVRPSTAESVERAWARFERRGAGNFRFDHPDARHFASQYFHRHRKTTELSDELGNLAVVLDDGPSLHVLFIDPGDDDPATAVSFLDSLKRYAQGQGKTLMLFTTEERWRAAGDSAGLTELRGSLAVLADDRGSDGAWTVFGGDRA